MCLKLAMVRLKETLDGMDEQSTRRIEARARVARGWSLGLYIAGIAALGVGVLVGGIVAAASGSVAGWTAAAIIIGGGAATGGLGLWESRRFDRRASQLERAASEHRLYTLAEAHGGTLRVVDAARGLQMASDDAEALLDGLVDEVRVSLQVSDEGEMRYVFQELSRARAPRVRVEASSPEAAEESTVDPETAKNS